MIAHKVKLGKVTWTDIVSPTREELDQIATEFNLHHTAIHDCLEPEHLPKYEKFGDTHFLILRSIDPEADSSADTVQELTRKLAIFISKEFLLTVHRTDLNYLQAVEKQLTRSQRDMCSLDLAADLILAVAKTYEPRIEEAQKSFEDFETEIFNSEHRWQIELHDSYFLKRHVAIMKRMLRLMLDPISHLKEMAPAHVLPEFHNAREYIDKLVFQLDEIQDNLNALLSLQISLASQKTNEASHKTNEVMRVLTIFSVFFLPLNFIAGIYGMNFEDMPELKSPHGYPAVLVAMVLVAFGIYAWFVKSGWIHPSGKSSRKKLK